MKLEEPQVQILPIDRFVSLVGDDAGKAVLEQGAAAQELLAGRTVWNINTTATGGGVAEMLQTLIGYGRGAGVDTRWVVMQGDSEFFRMTKRMHNFFHGSPGDGGALGEAERAHFEEIAASNGQELAAVVREGDVVLVHDPQPAALVPILKAKGAHVIWRSHIGIEATNEWTDAAWSFVRPYVEHADVCVFSRREYVPSWLERPVRVIPPSIDPFAVKNAEMPDEAVLAILAHVGLVRGSNGAAPTFHRLDGSPARVDHVADVVRAGPPPKPDQPLVVQVSRWDRLKDMHGVMMGFADHVDGASNAHLSLIGPNVSGVTDDPEGAEVLDECINAWQQLPHSARARISLVCLPMHDTEENAAIVNALQRHATVVVQKSLAEGFGLTVAEALWKARPFIGGDVGGIPLQVEDGKTGYLVSSPEECADRALRILREPGLGKQLGRGGKEHVRTHFLTPRLLRDWLRIFKDLE